MTKELTIEGRWFIDDDWGLRIPTGDECNKDDDLGLIMEGLQII